MALRCWGQWPRDHSASWTWRVPGLGHRPGQGSRGRKDFPVTVCLQTQGKHGLTCWPLLLPCGPKSWGW